MASIIFWDVIPIYGLHSYQCHAHSGFTINKTIEQWKHENPGVAETLVSYESLHPSIAALPPEKYLYKTELKYPEGNNTIIHRQHFRYPSGFEVVFEYDVKRQRYDGSEVVYPEVANGFYLNARFAWLTFRENVWDILYKKDERVIDTLTGETISQSIDFYTNLTNPLVNITTSMRDFKVWMKIDSCNKKNKDKWLVGSDSFGSLESKFKRINGEIQ